jgi:hypothetical protein
MPTLSGRSPSDTLLENSAISKISRRHSLAEDRAARKAICYDFVLFVRGSPKVQESTATFRLWQHTSQASANASTAQNDNCPEL